MDFIELSNRAAAIRARYRAYNDLNGHAVWTTAEYVQGCMGDVGQLAKLVMARNGYRTVDDVDQRIGHELADCLWSVFINASELGIDLERAFLSTMDDIESRLEASASD